MEQTVTVIAIRKDREIELSTSSWVSTNFHHSSDKLCGSGAGYCHFPETAKRRRLVRGPRKKMTKMTSTMNSTILRVPSERRYQFIIHPSQDV
jgi:hypothetical protein